MFFVFFVCFRVFVSFVFFIVFFHVFVFFMFFVHAALNADSEHVMRTSKCFCYFLILQCAQCNITTFIHIIRTKKYWQQSARQWEVLSLDQESTLARLMTAWQVVRNPNMRRVRVQKCVRRRCTPYWVATALCSRSIGVKRISAIYSNPLTCRGWQRISTIEWAGSWMTSPSQGCDVLTTNCRGRFGSEWSHLKVTDPGGNMVVQCVLSENVGFDMFGWEGTFVKCAQRMCTMHAAVCAMRTALREMRAAFCAMRTAWCAMRTARCAVCIARNAHAACRAMSMAHNAHGMVPNAHGMVCNANGICTRCAQRIV